MEPDMQRPALKSFWLTFSSGEIELSSRAAPCSSYVVDPFKRSRFPPPRYIVSIGEAHLSSVMTQYTHV